MKRVVLLFVVAVGIMMAFTHDLQASQPSPEWLSASIECGASPKEFIDNLSVAIGQAPISYYNDVTLVLFLMYYTDERSRGIEEPIGPSFNEGNAISHSLNSVFKICTENRPFSLAKFENIEAGIQKKQKTFYEEFTAKHKESLRKHLETYHNAPPKK